MTLDTVAHTARKPDSVLLWPDETLTLPSVLRRNEKVELIKRVPLFADCSRGELEEIAQLADEIDLAEGKELTRLGEPGREFFVLLEGEADVTQDGNSINTLERGRLLRRDRARRGHASDRHGHRDHARCGCS